MTDQVGGAAGVRAPSVNGEVGGAEATARESLLVEPMGAAGLGGDVGMQVALLIERSLSARRASAAVRRDAADQAQDAAEKSQVASMREEARDTFNQALVSCAISVAAASLQMRAARVELDGAKLGLQAASLPESLKAGLVAQAKVAETTGKCREAGAKIVEALSGGASGVMGADVKRDGADAKEHENAAHRASRESQRAADAERELGELATKTLARLEEQLQGQHQTQLALIQRV